MSVVEADWAGGLDGAEEGLAGDEGLGLQEVRPTARRAIERQVKEVRDMGVEAKRRAIWSPSFFASVYLECHGV